MRDPIIGIDLGTSNSVVAATDDAGNARVLADGRGDVIQPSAVSFHPGGSVLVGARAKQRRILDPRNTIYSAKRLLGRVFDSREVREAAERLPFTIKQGVNRQPVVVTRAGELSVPEVTAIVLDHLRAVAQGSLETEVGRAVIAVPANATDAQRAATLTAGQIAGLDIVQVLNEPTAAALAYGHRRTLDHVVAVYDFGGGTFDVTILQVKDAVYEVLATAGDPFLGGDDIDDRMVATMVAQFQAEHGMDLRADEQAMQRLRSVAEQVKVELSRRPRAMVRIDEVARTRDGKPIDFSVRIGREQLEAEATPVVEQSFTVCREALRMAGLDAGGVHAVILVGGTTKMPLVRAKVAAFFGREPRRDVDPDQAVALGTALQGHALWNQLGERKRRPTARGAVVPPAPPMEARAPASRRPGDEAWARGSTMPRVAFWEDAPGDPGAPGAEDSATLTVDTMDVPTVDVGSWEGAAGFRKPAPGSRDYVGKPGGGASSGPEPPASPPPGEQDGAATPPTGSEVTRERAPAEFDSSGDDTRVDDPTVPARGRSILNDLDLESLGVEIHRGPDATGARPLELAQLGIGQGSPGPHGPGQGGPGSREPHGTGPEPAAGARAGPAAGDSQADIPTNVHSPSIEGAGARAGEGAGEGAGAADRGPGGGRPSSEISLPPAASGGEAPRSPEGRRTLQHPAGAPLPASEMSPAPVILDVTPYSLGIGTVAGYCRSLLQRNARVPAEIQEVFTTSKNLQQTVRIRVCQGESRRLDENVILGDLVLEGIEPRPRGETRIEVTFHMDESGILQVRARDQHTGREQRAELQLLGMPSEEEITSASQRIRLLRRPRQEE